MERAAGESTVSGRAQGIEAVTAVDRFARVEIARRNLHDVVAVAAVDILSAPSPPMMMSA